MPATEQSVALPPRYRVVRHIASGGMASVWAAEDELLGRLVAVKVLSPALSSDERAQRRFKREARAAARLGDCRHVVTIYDIGEHAGRAFMVMEHFSGGTVADRLRTRRPIPRPAAVRWLRETAEALDCAHGHNVVHRDVKPANLLLDERGRLAVGDFGIATVASESSLTQTGQVLGTAAYLSPEQARGRPATAASDRYALAVVAFELLTGRRPFAAEHPAAQARQHVEDTVPNASAAAQGLTPEIDDVLQAGMAKDPADRPATAAAFVARLEAALGDEAAAVEEPTAATRPVRAGAAAAAVRRTPREAPRRAPASPRRPVPPATPPPAVTGRRRRSGWLAALAALLLAVAGVALAIATTGGGGGGRDSASTGSNARKASAARKRGTTPKRTQHQQPQQTAQAQASPRPQTSTQPPAQTSPATPKQPKPKQPKPQGGSANPAALNDQGFSLIQQGDPSAAVPVLQRSVQGYRSQGQTSGLPYAFALYNLGNALRLSGRPAEAIPILQERLRVSDNQRSTVERELALACSQAGQDCGGSTNQGPGSGNSGKGGGGHSGEGEGGDD